MKKIISVIILAVMLFSISMADGIDLSAMSYDELISLRNELESEIISRPEWKRVKVPVGIWTVGVDIPAGIYSVEPPDGTSVNFAAYDENGRLKINILCPRGQVIGKVELLDGWTIDITKYIYLAPPVSLEF